MKKRKKLVSAIIIGCLLVGGLCNHDYIKQSVWSNALLDALYTNNTIKVQELLSDTEMDINKKGGYYLLELFLGGECSRETPFEAACETGNLEHINLLLDAGAKPEVEYFHLFERILSSDGTWKECHECVKRLMQTEEIEDYMSEDGGTALVSISSDSVYEDDSFSKEKSLDILALYKLAEKNYKKDETSDGTTVLHRATVWGNNLELIKYLIEEKNYPIDVKNELGETPLIQLFKVNETKEEYNDTVVEIIDYYVDHGADVNLADKDGKSVYDYATEIGVQDLLKR